jgi:hypothetical protein
MKRNWILYLIIFILNIFILGCSTNPNKNTGSVDQFEGAKRAFFEFYKYTLKADHINASKQILPEDLNALKEFFISLINRIMESNHIELQHFANELLKGKNIDEITPEEFYSNFMYCFVTEDVQRILMNSEIEIINCYQNNENNTVIIEYKLKHPLIEMKDLEILIFQNGKWYLKFRQDVNQIKDVIDIMLDKMLDRPVIEQIEPPRSPLTKR